MPEDIKDTQTGGTGVTVQEGSKKPVSKPVENVDIKPVAPIEGLPVESTDGGVDSEQTNAGEGSVADKPVQKPVAEDPIVDNIEEEEEVPMVADLQLPSSTYSMPADISFETPEEEDEEEIPMVFETPEEDDPFDVVGDPEKKQNVIPANAEEAQARYDEGYRMTGQHAKTSRGGITGLYASGSTGFEMSIPGAEPTAPKKINTEILSYPHSNKQYRVIDNKWHDRDTDTEEWKEIKSKGRVLGLEKKHSIGADIPESQNKPKVGGVNENGIQIMGFGGRPDNAYTIKGDAWYRLVPGKEWEKVTKEENINSLNNYHKKNVSKNDDERASRYRATIKERADIKPLTSSDDYEESGKTPTQYAEGERAELLREEAEVIKELGVTYKAGEISRDRFGDMANSAVSVARDENGDAIVSAKTNGNALFLADRPSDSDDGFNMMPATQKEYIEKHMSEIDPAFLGGTQVITKKQESIEELTSKKEEAIAKHTKENQTAWINSNDAPFEESEGYKRINDNWNDRINDEKQELSDLIVKQEVDVKDYKAKREYMDSDKYRIDKENSATFKKAKIQESAINPETFDEDLMKIAALDAQIDAEKLQIFIDKDIDKWALGTNYSPSQIDEIKAAQKRAKVSVGVSTLLGVNVAGLAIADIEEYTEAATVNNNKFAEAVNTGRDINDVLLENKKIYYQNNRGIINTEVAQVFSKTLAIHEFLSEHVNNGDITINTDGGYIISKDISSAAKEHIETNLTDLIEKYEIAKRGIYSNVRKLASKKTKELNSLLAAMSELESGLKDGSLEMNPITQSKMDSTNEEIKTLQQDIKDLGSHENTIFLTRPKEIAVDVAKNTTASARHIMTSVPEGMTSKQKFDFFFEGLVKKNKQIAADNDINEDYFEELWAKVRDVAGWEGLGVDLSQTEKDYYKNRATLLQLTPLYLNNDWGATSDSAGFWDNLGNTMMKTFSPVMAESLGFYSDTDAINTMVRVIQDPSNNLSEEDLVSGLTLTQMIARNEDVSWYGSEGGSNLLGATAAMMFEIFTGAGVVAKGQKYAKGIAKLIEKQKSLIGVTEALKDFKVVQKTITESMKSRKFTKYLLESGTHGKNMAAGGILFNDEQEQLTFMHGLGGAMAGKGIQALFKNLPPSEVLRWFGNLFGASTDKGVAVLKRYGEALTGINAIHYRGLGEIPEEFAQELVTIYRSELTERGFFGEIEARFGKISDATQFMVTCYTMGAAIGSVMISTEQAMLETMTDEEIKMAKDIYNNHIAKDMASANADGDIAAERIANHYEASVESLTKPKKRSQAPKEAEVKTDKVDGEPTSEGEIIRVATAAEAEAKWDEGYRIDGIDSKSDIKGLFATGRPGIDMKKRSFKDWLKEAKDSDLTLDEAIAETESDFKSSLTDAKKRGLTMEEFVAEQEVKQADKVEVEEKTLADKIRAKKGVINPNELSDVTRVIPIKIWNAALEGAAFTVENVAKAADYIRNSSWFKNELDDAGRLKVETEIENARLSGATDPRIDKSVKKDIEETTGVKKNRQDKKDYLALTSKIKGATTKVEVEASQQGVIDYAKEVLPKKDYTKAKALTVARMVKRATTPKEIQKALDYIDAQAHNFQEETRVDSAEKLIKDLKNPQLKRRGDKKVGKISIEASKDIKALSESFTAEEILNMPQEQIEDINEQLNEILHGGKLDILAKEKEIVESKQKQRKIYHDELSKKAKAEKTKLNSKEEIKGFFAGKKGVIYIDDKVFSSVTALETYLKDNNLTYEDLSSLEATYDAEGHKDTVPVFNRVTRFITDSFTLIGRTLESRTDDIARGSKVLRTELNEKITMATNDAYITRNNGRKVKRERIAAEVAKRFGKKLIGGIPSGLVKDTGIRIKSPKSKQKVKVDHAIDIYTMAQVDASTIYKVGDIYFDSKSEADERVENSGLPLEEVTSKYNPQVLRQISQDNTLKGGIEKIEEINEYVESDENLKGYADWLLNDFYVDSKNEYKEVFEQIYNLEIKEGPYVPMNRKVHPDMDTNPNNLLGTDNNKSAASSMSEHLKERMNPKKVNAKYDFETGATSKALNYTNTMEHANAFMPVAENYKDLVNKNTRPLLEATLGKKRVKALESKLNDIISDGGNTNGANDAHKILATLLKAKVVTTLMLKPGSILKQLTSFTHYLGAGLPYGVGTSDVLAQMGKLVTVAASGVTGTQQQLLSREDAMVVKKILNDAFVRDRISGKDIDFELRKLNQALDDGNFKNATDLLSKFLLMSTVVGDIAGVLSGGIPLALALYKNNVKNKNMSEQDALDHAYSVFVKVSNDTQQSTQENITSQAQENIWMRSLLTFKTSQTAAMSQLAAGSKVVGDILSGNKGEYTLTEGIRAGRKVMYYTASQALFVMIANGTLGMIFGDDNDDDDPVRQQERQATAIWQLMLDTISSDLQGLGIPGLVGDWALNNARNREAFNNIPVVQMIQDIATVLGGNIMGNLDGGDITTYNESGVVDISESDVNKRNKLFGLKNINTMVESWSQWKDGDINALDAFMGRTIDEETGHKYQTAYERGDELYEYFYPKTANDDDHEAFEGSVDKELSGEATEKEMVDQTFGESESLTNEMGSPFDGETSYQEEVIFKNKKRNKDEKEKKRNSAASLKSEREKREKMAKPSGSAIKTSPTKVKVSKKQEREDLVSSYEYQFGKKPPKNWSILKIKEVLYAAD